MNAKPSTVLITACVASLGLATFDADAQRGRGGGGGAARSSVHGGAHATAEPAPRQRTTSHVRLAASPISKARSQRMTALSA